MSTQAASLISENCIIVVYRDSIDNSSAETGKADSLVALEGMSLECGMANT